jgi:hypothetical protein
MQYSSSDLQTRGMKINVRQLFMNWKCSPQKMWFSKRVLKGDGALFTTAAVPSEKLNFRALVMEVFSLM